MRSVSSTIARLAAQHPHQAPRSLSSERLAELKEFGSNPGALDAWYYAPADMPPGGALVVVLHGCTQNAVGFDQGTGWSQLAEEYGFAVLLPEQTRSNNFNLCFNWYESDDNHRGAGEPLSIRQMIAAMVKQHKIDPARVFVTGLSAGGAMTSVMLATYPDVFAGGAIVAGLPFGSASNLLQAFDRMRGHGGPSALALAAAIRCASPQRTTWPRVAVWHGTHDNIVDKSNGSAIVEQWRQVHGAGVAPDRQDTVEGYPHNAWHDAAGRVILEEYLITGMGHGTPLATSGDEACGASGPYMLDVAISSTRHIAKAWGLSNGDRKTLRAASDVRTASDGGAPAWGNSDVGVIESALRAAGLMK